MVKVYGMKREGFDENGKHIIAELVADTPDEVIACGTSGANIIGLTAEHILTLGSIALCADGSMGMLDSNGNWNF